MFVAIESKDLVTSVATGAILVRLLLEKIRLSVSLLQPHDFFVTNFREHVSKEHQHLLAELDFVDHEKRVHDNLRMPEANAIVCVQYYSYLTPGNFRFRSSRAPDIIFYLAEPTTPKQSMDSFKKFTQNFQLTESILVLENYDLEKCALTMLTKVLKFLPRKGYFDSGFYHSNPARDTLYLKASDDDDDEAAGVAGAGAGKGREHHQSALV
jgi:hypothetical protein